ncbi:hypothetical protein BN1708_011462 [Verticillium longisporum]|uniref:Uncharacterized protein n=1 Tax=Verticillium longisporum TaxID=100787 RepID=A0A0G4L0B5_VERLO|nr:hypothetical protein BN1708_011462 [Verticillium longisporum]
MDSSLPQVWQAAGVNGAFLPAIGKNSQFYVAFALLLTGLSLTGAFALSIPHDMIQRSISVETTDREEPLMPPLTRAPRRGPTDERRHPGAPWLRPYSGLRLPVGDGVTQSSPDLNAPVAADPPGA